MAEAVAVVLAAGKSKRFGSDLPKVVHEVAGRPLVRYVLDAVRAAGIRRTIVVVGHRAELVREVLSGESDVEFALQPEQKGTGHAVMMCRDPLADHDGPVLVLAGDTPLLQGRSLTTLLDQQRENRAACVIGTAETEANSGLGRIVRSASGDFESIVEEKDATPEQRAIREINTGCYVFDAGALFASLNEVRPDNRQGELYLTDCPRILQSQGKTVIARCAFDSREAMGVNTPEEMEAARAILESGPQRT